MENAAKSSGPGAATQDLEVVPARSSRRRVILIAVAAVVLVAGLLYYLHARQFEDTDDAQIDTDISNISPRVPGTVTAVKVQENQRVAAGDVLATIDATDLEVALAQARAAVAAARAQLAAEDPNVFITANSNAAALTTASSSIASAAAGLNAADKEVAQARASLVAAQAANRNAQLELQRGQRLFEHQALPKADLERLQSAAQGAAAQEEVAVQAVASAQARADQQRAQVSATRSRFTEVQKNAPREVETRQAMVVSRQANLELAQAQQRQAQLNLDYAQIRTPVAGIVARKLVSLGDRVVPGQQIVAVVQNQAAWVTANYRETQLRRMIVGQPASLHVDALDRDFSGKVESLGAATGSRLSVLPPENASGNYVKVVQRIPVRIGFDPQQPGLELLRPGMSVESKVRVSP
jgi:membrane fusion protein (multidrug efflux system)